MAENDLLSRTADAAATAELASLFAAHALAIIIDRLHAADPFTQSEVERLHLALEPLRMHAEASKRDSALGIYATIHGKLPPRPTR